MRKPPDPGEHNWRRIKATVKPLRRKALQTRSPEPVEGRVSANRPSTGSGLRASLSEPAQSPFVSSEVEKPKRQRVLSSLDTNGKASRPITVAPDLIRSRSRPDTLPATLAEGRGDPLPSTPLAKDWERSLRTGRVQPDMVIDLHGHNLAAAHTALGRALDAAAAQGARILLVIAGKSRGAHEAPRGAIRRELATWLAHSHHAERILAVRNAHPRHGGAGALYLVLRR